MWALHVAYLGVWYRGRTITIGVMMEFAHASTATTAWNLSASGRRAIRWAPADRGFAASCVAVRRMPEYRFTPWPPITTSAVRFPSIANPAGLRQGADSNDGQSRCAGAARVFPFLRHAWSGWGKLRSRWSASGASPFMKPRTAQRGSAVVTAWSTVPGGPATAHGVALALENHRPLVDDHHDLLRSSAAVDLAGAQGLFGSAPRPRRRRHRHASSRVRCRGVAVDVTLRRRIQCATRTATRAA